MHGFETRDRWLAAAALVLVAIFAVSRFAPGEPPLIGRASAVDGDTLRIAGERVRIVGIDAPELAQKCADARGAEWRCGEAAKARLVSLVSGLEMHCRPQGRDRYGRVLAQSAAGDVDLGETRVRQGFAIADGDYFAAEAEARAAKAGIWAGSFMQPARWRREHESDGADSGPWDIVRRWFR